MFLLLSHLNGMWESDSEVHISFHLPGVRTVWDAEAR